MAGSEITVDGDVVTKLHRPGTDPHALAARLRIAARLDCLLSPLSTEPEEVGTRWRTRWPRVQTVRPDPQDAPWAESARLLAQLHRETIGEPLECVGNQRLQRALDALLDTPAAAVIRRAAVTLPDDMWCRQPSTPVHGDWHLGQIGRRDGRWFLIDVDDLCVGNPAWDLARPAGFWAAGLLPDADWSTFLDAYRDAGGPAVPAFPVDPWPVLDPFARAAAIVAAAHGVGGEAGALLLDACARMR